MLPFISAALYNSLPETEEASPAQPKWPRTQTRICDNAAPSSAAWHASNLEAATDVAERDQDVVVHGVAQVVDQVRDRSGACHEALHKHAQHRHHRQAAVGDLLVLERLQTLLSLRGEREQEWSEIRASRKANTLRKSKQAR